MICLCAGFGCEDAKPYYYDVACPEDEQDIPEPVVEHIQSCTQCQESIAQLEFLLEDAAQASYQDTDHPDVLIASLLELHLSYLGHEVTCTTAKPFLPTLADETLRIRVKTPITEHIDACQACRNDVEALRNLQLSAKQLYRFGQFLADSLYSEALEIAIPSETLEALALCKMETLGPEDIRVALKQQASRAAIQQRRKDHCQTLEMIPTTGPWCCEEIQAHHLFSLALPLPTAGSDEMSAADVKSLQDHVRACSHCLQKLLDVEGILFGIVERPNSAEVTLMTIEALESIPEVNPDHGGRGFWHIIKHPTWRSGVGVAAAMILITMLVFSIVRESTAIAVDYDAMVSALDNVSFVKTVRTKVSTGEVLETNLYDQQEDRYLIRQRASETYWDFADKRFIKRQVDSDQSISRPINEKMLAQVRLPFETFHGILPNRAHIPAGSQWIPIKEDFYKGIRVEIRELLIPKHANLGEQGGWKQRRVYLLELETNRPLRIESYQRLGQSEEFTLESVTDILYPREGEVNLDFSAFLDSVKQALQDKTE